MSEKQFTELSDFLKQSLSRPEKIKEMISALHSLQYGQSKQNGLTTGGDSYARILARVLADDLVILTIKQRGKLPLHRVKINVSYVPSFGSTSFAHPQGDMPVGLWEEIPEYNFRVEGHRRMNFKIGFNALNGQWTERLFLA